MDVVFVVSIVTCMVRQSMYVHGCSFTNKYNGCYAGATLSVGSGVEVHSTTSKSSRYLCNSKLYCCLLFARRQFIM